MTGFDWSSVPISALSTFHLLLGMLIGYVACYFARPDSPPQPAGGQDLRQFRAAMDGVLLQAKQLASLSQSQNSNLPPSFLEAIAKLLAGIGALQAQVAGRGGTAASKIGAAAKPTSQVEQAAVEDSPGGREFVCLTGDMYEELTRNDMMPESDDDPLLVRRAYEATQYMAAWKGSLPHSNHYREVQCHDLSASGISFFTKELPACQFITITLGPEHELLMQAEVVAHQRRQRGRAFLYLVGCRFVKRFDHVPEECQPVTFATLD